LMVRSNLFAALRVASAAAEDKQDSTVCWVST